MNRRYAPVEQAQQHYLVKPRALAGGGDLRHISAFLCAAGWQDRTKARGPLILTNPARTVRITYDPTPAADGWALQAKATAHWDTWAARLSARTPVEILAGLTDAFVNPQSAHAPSVWAPLEEQKWRAPADAGHLMVSPDSTSWMRFKQPSQGPALWWAGARDRQGNGWTASLTATTPLKLVEAFSTALASPEPVMRPRGHVPFSAQIRTTSVSVRPSELAAWQQARLASARSTAWNHHSPRAGHHSPRAGHHSPVPGLPPRPGLKRPRR